MKNPRIYKNGFPSLTLLSFRTNEDLVNRTHTEYTIHSNICPNNSYHPSAFVLTKRVKGDSLLNSSSKDYTYLRTPQDVDNFLNKHDVDFSIVDPTDLMEYFENTCNEVGMEFNPGSISDVMNYRLSQEYFNYLTK